MARPGLPRLPGPAIHLWPARKQPHHSLDKRKLWQHKSRKWIFSQNRNPKWSNDYLNFIIPASCVQTPIGRWSLMHAALAFCRSLTWRDSPMAMKDGSKSGLKPVWDKTEGTSQGQWIWYSVSHHYGEETTSMHIWHFNTAIWSLIKTMKSYHQWVYKFFPTDPVTDAVSHE